METNLRWFDRFLKSAPATDFPRVRYFVVGLNQWRTAQDWPPAEAAPVSLYLHSHGQLTATRATREEPPDRFESDPANPIPVEPPGGEPMPRSSMFRPVDRRTIEERHDVVIYTASPQAELMLVAGNPSADPFLLAVPVR